MKVVQLLLAAACCAQLAAGQLIPTIPSLRTRARYPAGQCRADQAPPVCPGQTCAPGSCGKYFYAAATNDQNGRVRQTTYAVTDFSRGCDTQMGCQRCALYQILRNKCGAGNNEACTNMGWYVVMRAREGNDDKANPKLCFTNNHWMVLPTAPCPGVETNSPDCTGLTAERLWRVAFEQGVAKGNFPAAPESNGPSWTILLNPANRRSQHQLHIRMAGLVTTFSVARDFKATKVFSVDVTRPTVIQDNNSGRTLNAAFASVFVVADPYAIASSVRPYATASRIAAAGAPGAPPRDAPYGVMMTRHSQMVMGRMRSGFVVTAVWNIGGSQLLDESISRAPADCADPCGAWALQPDTPPALQLKAEYMEASSNDW